MKKALFITGLSIVAISASSFMVIESARYYISHYPDEVWKGYWLAGMQQEVRINRDLASAMLDALIEFSDCVGVDR